jgi:hypothetical protein
VSHPPISDRIFCWKFSDNFLTYVTQN